MRTATNRFLTKPGAGWTILIFLYWVVSTIIHVLLAVGVYDAAKQLQKENRRVFLVSGWVWALATLIGGIITAVIYWAINHSTFRPSDSKE